MKTITITVSKIALITKKSEHKPSVVCVIFMSGHKSIKYVFITLRLESFEMRIIGARYTRLWYVKDRYAAPWLR